jgi:hypothetical protein
MVTDQPALGAELVSPLQMSSDPVASIEEARESGTLAADREETDTPEELQALVTHWLTKTSNYKAFDDLCKQVDLDEEAIDGGSEAENEDDSANTTNHIYRNATQTVAMLVPEFSSLKRKVRAMVEPEPGEPVNPQVVKFKRQARGLASTLEVLSDTYLGEIDFQTTLEAWVQDACHYPIAILKVMWQSRLEDDAVSQERLTDDQESFARLAMLSEQYSRGEFTKTDYQYQELRDLMVATQKPKLWIRQGLLIEGVPARQWRCDPRVTGPENVDSAAWQRQDILMSRAEILSKWEHINPDELGSAQVYGLDEQGRWLKQNAQDKQSRASVSANTRDPQATTRGKDDDLLLVCEIYDAESRQVLVLVEGLAYPAAKYPMDEDEDGFPFVPIVLNRRSGRLAGFSDTQLQRKAQKGRNELRSAEEIARDLAQPRWAYDPAQVSETVMDQVVKARPGESVAIPLNGRDIRQAIMPLVGTHEYRADEYDVYRFDQELAMMAALPDAAKGGMGSAKFSSEVQVAASGASILTEHRQGIINRALVKLVKKIDRLMLKYVGTDTAVQFAGPLAAQYWPADYEQRKAQYEWLHIVPDVNISQRLDQSKRMDNIARLLDAGARAGARFPAKAIVKLMGTALGDEEVADLIQPDPNALVGDLAQTTQELGVQALAPESIQALAQIAQQAMAMLQQQQMQAAAAEQQQQQAQPSQTGA